MIGVVNYFRKEKVMKVIVKRPGLDYEICELESISKINELVGNVDENGNAYNHGGSDIREAIAKNIDMYMNESALFNNKLKPNLWNQSDSALICGTVVFAGHDKDNHAKACSLTQEQIDYCKEYIAAKVN